MSTILTRSMLEVRYLHAAQAYQASLPPEHYMEATPHATQRKITVESLDLVSARRPEVQVFNELLVQYPFGPDQKIQQVVPDNMVVLHAEPIKADGSFDLPLQPAKPFLVIEYVSKSSKRKDYEDNFRRYDRELKVLYYLLFYPETQDLSVFRRGTRRYGSVKPNEAGRLEIPELELEVALLEGWVRYWFRGELLALPAELARQLEDVSERLRLSQEQTRSAQEQTRLAQEQARSAQEQARSAQEQARLAQDRENLERQQKERALAQLRKLGIELDL